MHLLFALPRRVEFRPHVVASTEWGVHSQNRLYSTQGLNFVFNSLSYQDAVLIKQKRFGSQLEEFKKVYEAPCIETFTSIKQTRKWMGNRRGRNLVPRVLPIETIKRRKKLADRQAYQIKEAELQQQIQTYITSSRNDTDILSADTPEKRRRREAFVGAAFESVNYENDFDYEGEAEKDPTKATDMQEKYDMEKKISYGQLSDIVSAELKKEFIEHDLITYDRDLRARLSRVNDPKHTHHRIIDLALKVLNPKDVLLDRPAVAVKPRKPPPEIPAKPKIKKVSDLYPLAFETNSYPFDEEFYNPYHTRKVILYVKVNALELPTLVKERFVALAKQKGFYDIGKDLVILRSQKKRTKRTNRQYLVRILRAMLAESWKVDLNYIPAPEELLPHELVEQEVTERTAKEEHEKRNSFDVIKQQQQWTIFRLKYLPSPEELKNSRVAAQEYYKKTVEELDMLIK